MKNLFKKLLSGLVCSAILIQTLGGVGIVYADDTITEIYDEDFSEDTYTVDENWITAAGTAGNLPAGWGIVGYNGKSYSADNSIKVVSDPTGSMRGNVLEIIPDNAGYSAGINKLPGNVAKLSHTANKGLYVKQSMYIDKETAAGLLPVGAGHRFLFALAGRNLPYTRNSTTVTDIQASEVNGDNLEVTLHGVHHSSSTPDITSYDFPLDKWVDIEYYIDVPGIKLTDGTTYEVKYHMWIDGAYVSETVVSYDKASNSYDFPNYFYGIAFMPTANSMRGDAYPGSTVKPIVYIDDLYAAYIPATVCVTEDASATGDDNGGSFSIEFSSELDRDSFSGSAFIIEGVSGGFTDIVLEEDNKTVTFFYANNILDPGTPYVLKLSEVLKDKYLRSVDEFTVNFTTNSFVKYVTPTFEITSYSSDQDTATFVFSNMLEPSSISTSAFSIEGVHGAVSRVEQIDDYSVRVVFDLSALEPSTDYTVNIPGLRDEYTQAISDTVKYTTPVFDKFIYSDDFSSYIKNVNWIGGTADDGTDLSPSGWSIGPQNTGKYSSENTVMVVDDPTGDSRGAVLKMEAVKDNHNVTLRKLFVVNGAEARSVSHDKTKNLYIKQSLYVDKSTVSNYATLKDWYGSLVNVPYGYSNVGGHVAFTRIARNGCTNINDTTFDVTYGSKDMTTYTVSVPLGRWFDVEYIVNTTEEQVTKYDLWIDGVKVNDAELIGLRKTTSSSNFDENFYGVAFSPRAYVPDVSTATANPVMYIDNLYAAYVSPYVLEAGVESGGVASDDTSAVNPDDTLVLEFESALSEAELEKLERAVSSITVTDNLGNDVKADTVITVSRENIKVSMPHGFVYGRTYTVSVPGLDIYNTKKQKLKSTKAEFTVIPAKSGYISGYTLTTDDDKSIDTATAIEVEVSVNGKADKVYAAAYDSKGLKKVTTAAVTAGEAKVKLDTSADYIKLFLLNGEGRMISDAVIINPLNKTIPAAKVNAAASELIAYVSDAANSHIAVEAKTALKGNNHYGFVAVFADSKTNFDDYDIADAMALSDVVYDVNGTLASGFTFDVGSGTYYVWLVTDEGIQSTEFTYYSLSDIADMLRRLAITDKTDADYVKKSDIYETVIKYNEGIGLDTAGTFSGERAKNLLEYRVDKNRSSITGADDAAVIAAFMTIANDAAGEDKFLTELENPLNKQQIEYILKNNTQYTGIDFSDYTDVPSKVYYSFVGKTFENGDKVKEYFEDAYDSDDSDNSTSVKRPSKSGGGGGKTLLPVITPVVTDIAFTDIDSVPWAVDAINFLRDKKIVSGDGNSQFRPNDLVTRAEFTKMLVLALEKFSVDAKSTFSDVTDGDWFYSYVSSAYSQGIVNGCGDGTFMPQHNISRQDMAVMIYNSVNESASAEDGFADEAMIAEYALDAVRFLKQSGIVYGRSDNTFAPLENTTRAEAAAVICRLWQYVNGQEG